MQLLRNIYHACNKEQGKCGDNLSSMYALCLISVKNLLKYDCDY